MAASADMDELAKQYVISFYNKSAELFGDEPEAVRWTAKGQLARYRSLLDIADSIEGREVLDFGCGKGDLLTFLKERNISVRYTGLDINEKLISMARTRNPDAVFRVFDLDRDTLDEDFDFIFICGVFNLKVQGIDDTMRDTLKALFPHCRTGMALNALSSHNPDKDFELNYVSPEEILGFAVKELSPIVALRHDGMSYDFTLFVYRRANLLS